MTRIRGIWLAAALVPLVACGSNSTARPAASGGLQLVRDGRLTVCAQLPYKPFEYVQKGKVIGFDVAVLDLAAKRLGVTRDVIDTPFETIKTGAELNAGNCDVGAGGMTITAERKKHIDFSAPYFDATQTMLASAGVTARSFAEVKAAKLRVGSLASTTGEDYLISHGINPRSYDLADALLNGLRIGDVDVVIMDSPIVFGWLKDPKNSAFHVVTDLRTGERYGFAFRKGRSARLRGVIDGAIQQAYADGTYKRLYETWIGPYRAAGQPR